MKQYEKGMSISPAIFFTEPSSGVVELLSKEKPA
jgi:hypothetical protein